MLLVGIHGAVRIMVAVVLHCEHSRPQCAENICPVVHQVYHGPTQGLVFLPGISGP